MNFHLLKVVSIQTIFILFPLASSAAKHESYSPSLGNVWNFQCVCVCQQSMPSAVEVLGLVFSNFSSQASPQFFRGSGCSLPPLPSL